jgi:hypothetical protein
MKKFILPSILAAALVLGFLPYALASGFYKSITVHSGVQASAGHHRSSLVRGVANPVPYSIRLVTPPKSGKATIARGSERTNIYYQSKPGFVGQDSFQYVRVSDDRFAGTYTVAVTVK